MTEPRFPSFENAIGGPLRRNAIEILQINVGKLCNQTCSHCHVDAGPRRTEIMSVETARDALRLLDLFPTITSVDITGGAPELNPHFRWLARQARARGKTVSDRCNLTVLLVEGQADLAEFLAAHKIEIVASLPCYLQENVDKQRGKGVYEKSIQALRRLNRLGYGRGNGLTLNLVYNPAGTGLPPPQASLQADYKKRLLEDHGVVFDQLLTLTNMPISRFERFLHATGQLEAYQRKLEDAFNSATIPQLMCRHTLSVSWDGFLYDCDFNQMLDMRIQNGGPLTVHNVSPDLLDHVPIRTARHCFGCTAGTGSSCGGALVGGSRPPTQPPS